MPILRDVRTILKRRSKTNGKPNGTETGMQTAAPDAPGVPWTRRWRRANGIVESKPVRTEPRTYDEVMGLVRKIGQHLDKQTERTEQLLTLLDRVPQAVEALPEINRQNARLLEALHEHFHQANRREELLNSTLSVITKTSGRQTDVLGLIQQQLDAKGQSTQQFTSAIGELQQALTGLADSNSRVTDVLAQMSVAADEREAALGRSLRRTQRWMMVAVVVCGVAALGALVTAIVALV